MSADDELLLSPGPVPVADEVREAMDAQMISHRSDEFEAIYERAQRGLDYVFTRSKLGETSTSAGGTALVLNGTATMGMEAAVSNLAGDDDEVVALENGKFGRRFARIAERHASCTRVDVPWGESFDIEAIGDAITDETAVVAMVHNETSTGIRNPVEAVGKLAVEHDAAFVVDGVTSIGGDEFRVDDWNVDIAITDSQKALAAPPGVSAVYVSDRIVDALDGDRGPFYADLEWYLRKAGDNQTPFTSAVPLINALAVAVERIEREGMGNRIARHRRQSGAFREAFRAMGLELFPTVTGNSAISNTVTAVSLPDSVRESPDAFFDAVSGRGVSISGGQAHLGGEIFRVSNMGELPSDAILRGVEAVGEALRDVDVDIAVSVDAAVETAAERLES